MGHGIDNRVALLISEPISPEWLCIFFFVSFFVILLFIYLKKNMGLLGIGSHFIFSQNQDLCGGIGAPQLREPPKKNRYTSPA